MDMDQNVPSEELVLKGEMSPEAIADMRSRIAAYTAKPDYEVAAPIDFQKRDQERGAALIDAFIREVNADHSDVITISRNKGCFMRDEIERLRKLESKIREVIGDMSRETQESVAAWCRETFPEFQGIRNRCIVVVEEVAELALEAGLSPEMIRATVEVPIGKEIARGYTADRTPDRANLAEEVADVQLSLFAFAEEAQINTKIALDYKMAKNRLRPNTYYRAKTAQKVGLGMPLRPVEPSRDCADPWRDCPDRCACHLPDGGGAVECGTKTNMLHEPCCGVGRTA